MYGSVFDFVMQSDAACELITAARSRLIRNEENKSDTWEARRGVSFSRVLQVNLGI